MPPALETAVSSLYDRTAIAGTLFDTRVRTMCPSLVSWRLAEPYIDGGPTERARWARRYFHGEGAPPRIAHKSGNAHSECRRAQPSGELETGPLVLLQPRPFLVGD